MAKKLAEKMVGNTLELRENLTVKVKPLGNLLSAYLRDLCIDYNLDTGQPKINLNQLAYLTCAYGIDEATLDGKKLPMETVKVHGFGKTYFHLRFDELETFTEEEVGKINEAINSCTNLTPEEKN